MPGFNGTGPMGRGPMTGGGRGYCTSSGLGSTQGGYRGNPGGLGFGRGFGRGFRRRRSAPGYGAACSGSFAGAEYDAGVQDQMRVYTQYTFEETNFLRTRIEELKRAVEDIGKAVANLQDRSSQASI